MKLKVGDIIKVTLEGLGDENWLKTGDIAIINDLDDNLYTFNLKGDFVHYLGDEDVRLYEGKQLPVNGEFPEIIPIDPIQENNSQVIKRTMTIQDLIDIHGPKITEEDITNCVTELARGIDPDKLIELLKSKNMFQEK